MLEGLKSLTLLQVFWTHIINGLARLLFQTIHVNHDFLSKQTNAMLSKRRRLQLKIKDDIKFKAFLKKPEASFLDTSGID